MSLTDLKHARERIAALEYDNKILKTALRDIVDKTSEFRVVGTMAGFARIQGWADIAVDALNATEKP